MTTRTQQTNPSRWVLAFLAALVPVLATILSAATASAATTGVAETRVGAHNLTVEVLVEPPQRETAGQRLGKDVAGPGFVVAAGVARKGVALFRGGGQISCRTNSFDVDTPVLMADGTTKPIQDVDLDDQVYATDPVTGDSGARTVTDLIRHTGVHTMIRIELATGDSVDATEHHRFWVPERAPPHTPDTSGGWVDAVDLAAGDRLLTPGGDTVTITAVTVTTEDLTAYNLTIDALHTYHVGNDSVLVHNCTEGLAAKSVDELPGLLSTAPKPLGLGSTGRTVPQSIQEQMAMTSVRNSSSGVPIPRIKMGDSRWPGADGWVKMQQIEGDVNIHYVYNTISGAVDDFKFVAR